ncbi:hypothetical protein C2E20_1892 [Micractinium conductrix]|uniref:Uncharacterized protein n=1 Tax=Micractinium conductrix TaxID=554055 RepID=A0A2P6VLG7_9CHLO|nr:hypothetical protein C2E20_1892 [Micractinium conductrix]|eukprot:PSC74910.1 hypothetical protein C2E20_1892 [Micractinium conductrix]
MAKPSKRKRKEEDQEGSDEGLAARLAAYGERFLQMFDDHDSDREQQADAHAPAAADGSDISDASASSRSVEEGSSSDDEEQQEVNVVEHIFHAAPTAAAAAARPGQRGGGPAGGAGGAPRTPAAQAQAQQAAAEALRLKKERKRFMSSKAAVIVNGGGAAQHTAGGRRQNSGTAPASGGAPAALPGDSAELGVSKEEFREMQREVQELGASALDKKSRKAFEAERLARLGAKAEARPRIPASIGLGMAKKQAQREARALEEGIAAGMIQQKGLGKKKRREKAGQMDRGLNEDRGSFRPGIMRVKSPAAGRGGGGRGGRGRGGGAGRGGGGGGRRGW